MGEEAGNHDTHASFVERSKCQMGLGILAQTANDQEAWRLAGFEVDEDRSVVPVKHEMGKLELHCREMGGAVGADERLQCGSRQAESTSCNNSDATVGATNSAATIPAFLRKRAPQGFLLFGAIVAAAIYAVYRSRHRRSRPRPRRRPRDDDNRRATAATSTRWWQPGGVYGRWTKIGGEKTGDGEKEGSDEDNGPGCSRASGGGGDSGGEENVGDEAGCRVKGGEGACSSASSENDQERADSVDDDEDWHSDNDVPATGEVGDGWQSDNDAPATGEGGDQDGDESAERDGEGDEQRDEACAGGSPDRNRTDIFCTFFHPDAAPTLSRGLSLLSESSTEELLADADGLIADSEKASALPPSGSTSTRAATSSNRMSVDEGPGSGPNLPSGKKITGSRGTRTPKRARVYREMSGEEVDALVSLTHRALQLDPAALSEIAEEASSQKGGEDDGLSAGERQHT